ncbi:MAG: SusC/RagA family TonB-linked outer membrane protein [Draconibacterium sp.]
MKKIKTVFILLCILTTTLIRAQNPSVTGIVTDETGTPLPGVSVTISGSAKGVVTNEQGRFIINVMPSDKLLFSFIGMENQTIKVGTQTMFNVTLTTRIELLDEVVTVAYGVQRKADITASVASVRADEMQDVPAADVSRVIQGKLAGVRISSSSGMPGMANTILIRGAGSVNAGNAPLVVIDGVPVSSESDASMFNGQELNPLMDINPSDIESVDVLKDASAAALYGSRASNGVILITTKSGKRNRDQLEYNIYRGWGDIPNRIDFVNAEQFLTLQNEARENFNRDRGYLEGDAGFIGPIGDPATPLANTNWIDTITREKAKSENHQLSYTSGSENKSIYLSFNYVSQEGIVKTNSYERYSARFNADNKVRNWLDIGINSSFSKSDNNRIMGDNNIYGAWNNAMSNRPDEPVYNKDGSYYLTSKSNPVQCYAEPDYLTTIYNVLGNVYFNARIRNGLFFRSSLGGNYIHTKEKVYEPVTSLQGSDVNGWGSADNNTRTSIITESILNYQKKIGGFKLDALLGYSFQNTTVETAYVVGENFPSPSLTYLNSAALIKSGSTSWTKNALESYFGRVNIDYHQKYLLSVSFRGDGSSKFIGGNKWGYFPAGSVGWVISKEGFFSENKLVNFLKLRLSYGLTGNQEGIGNFASRVLISSGSDYNDTPGMSPQGSAVGNPDLTWEKNKQLNLGADVNLLGNRIEMFVEYYNNTTDDLLVTKNVSSSLGYTSIYDNVGSIRNTGLDFSVRTKNVTGKLNWETNFNIATLKNEVLKLYNEEPFSAGFAGRVEEGHPFASFYMIKALGVYQNEAEIPQSLKDAGVKPGDMKYDDFIPDGIINQDDRQFVGTPYPKVYGGLGNTLRYKGFDCNLFCEFSFGSKIYAMWRQGDGAGNLGYSLNTNSLQEYNERWTGEGTSNHTPRAVYGSQGVYNTQASTRFLENASYLRFKSLTLGYTIPSRVLGHAFDKIRVYGTIDNLYSINSYSGFDPEVNSFQRGGVRNSGSDIASIPQLRTFLIGATVSF